uniref:Uncharacterized protein n=1 Tax=Roseihalotalea indica TaxID=2867963 RepID=A0AA49JEZ2_9BACT|nr:hypothetical protein K4G66_18830 [Tunicatimonas sp. TK19036]
MAVLAVVAHKMEKRSKRYVLKHSFPFVEYSGMGTFLFLLGISITSYIQENSIEWILLILASSIALGLTYWLTNSRNRTLIFYSDYIKIKPALKGSFNVQLEDIEGYQLKETYSRTGLVYHVQVVTRDEKKLEFIKDAYSEYEKLPRYLKLFGVKYLGRTEIKWKHKHLYARIGVYSSIIAGILFVLVQLMKLMK